MRLPPLADTGPRIHYLKTRPEVIADDVRRGLSRNPKSLPSRLFYDDVGSALFGRIMRMPEYYPARCEQEILNENAAYIIGLMPAQEFILVDLGSGDGTKTRVLLDELVRQKRHFRYVPIDISAPVIEDQVKILELNVAGLAVEGVVGDVQTSLRWMRRIHKNIPFFALFLGGNIGNYDQRQSLSFLRNVYHQLLPGDRILCGFDLQKDPAVIRAAYDDSAGITAAFNYNLLMRLNRELEATFDLNTFVHYASYEPLDGVARSFLVSTLKQEVWIEQFGQSVAFEAWELIHTENSYKYTLRQLTALAGRTGFMPVAHLLDSRSYFTDAIWERR